MDTVGNMNIVVDKLFEKVKKLKQQSWEVRIKKNSKKKLKI